MLCRKRPRASCAAHERPATVSSSTSLASNSRSETGEDDESSGKSSRPSQLHVTFRLVCSHLYGARQLVRRAYGASCSREVLHLHLHRGLSPHPLSGLALETTRVTPHQRLGSIGCGFTAMLSISLSHASAASTFKASPRSSHAIYLRVASVRAAALREQAFRECQKLRAACDFASAAEGYGLLP